MGSLKHVASGIHHELSSSHLVGRAPVCALRPDNPLVSAQHASFRWTGTHWEVRDLGSRNGTFVGARKLQRGDSATLAAGMTLAFGDRNDLFELVDETPPAATAQEVGGNGVCHAEAGLLTLPDPDAPELTIFERSEGAWIAEAADGQRRAVQDGDVVHAGGRSWRLQLPTIVDATFQENHDQLTLAAIGLRFRVSRDEELVEVDIVHGDTVITLPPRAHSYLLATLARTRLRDQHAGKTPPSEHGWMYIPELLGMLATTEPHFNVAVYRARQQFAQTKVQGVDALFERRPQTREIRLGVEQLEVITF